LACTGTLDEAVFFDRGRSSAVLYRVGGMLMTVLRATLDFAGLLGELSLDEASLDEACFSGGRPRALFGGILAAVLRWVGVGFAGFFDREKKICCVCW
jgi:hypothetical protein